MLATLVMPCLASPYGHLRAKAAWVIGQYCNVEFPDGCCQGPTFYVCFQKVCFRALRHVVLRFWIYG